MFYYSQPEHRELGAPAKTNNREGAAPNQPAVDSQIGEPLPSLYGPGSVAATENWGKRSPVTHRLDSN